MVTADTIDELRRRASVSSLEALQALSASQGDLERAIEYLHAPRSATKSLQVVGVEIAKRMATELVAVGLWFECEHIDRDHWQFAVAPAAFSRLVAMHATLLGASAT